MSLIQSSTLSGGPDPDVMRHWFKLNTEVRDSEVSGQRSEGTSWYTSHWLWIHIHSTSLQLILLPFYLSHVRKTNTQIPHNSNVHMSLLWSSQKQPLCHFFQRQNASRSFPDSQTLTLRWRHVVSLRLSCCIDVVPSPPSAPISQIPF